MMINGKRAEELSRYFLDNLTIEGALRLAEDGYEVEINDGRIRAIHVPEK